MAHEKNPELQTSGILGAFRARDYSGFITTAVQSIIPESIAKCSSQAAQHWFAGAAF